MYIGLDSLKEYRCFKSAPIAEQDRWIGGGQDPKMEIVFAGASGVHGQKVDKKSE